MEGVNQAVTYLLGFKPYVLLPVILFIFAITFRMKIGQAIKSSLTIGIGFIGIFIIFGFFVAQIGPAVESLVKKSGLGFNTLDVGWPQLAAITWSYKLAPLLIILILAVNIIMLFFKLTRIVNIDIWNFWHFIFTGALVTESTGNVVLGIVAALVAAVIILKLADWAAVAVQQFSGLSGIAVSTLSALTYYPFGVVGDRLLSKIPGLNNLNANPEMIKKKLGIFGEPMIIGFLIGLLLGVGAGYEIKLILELAFSLAAVIYILPSMSRTLGQGLMPLSEQMKEFMKTKFPQFGETFIGLDCAVIVGQTSVIVTGLLLMPLALALAFVLPGVKFIPLGDLANMIGAMVMVVVATRGNVIRGFIIGIPILVGKLYIASFMAGIYTALARKTHFQSDGYQGLITSFLDGGNFLRFWIVQIFKGAWEAWLIVPVLAGILYWTYKLSKKPVNGDC